MATNSAIKENIVKALESKGGDDWDRITVRRVYFNTPEAYALIGGYARLYNSGRVEKATFKGERIANAHAFLKAYYDVIADEIVVSGNEDLAPLLFEAIKGIVDEAKEVEVKEEVNTFDKLKELKEYTSHFKDTNKGQAAYSAGMTLEEAKKLNWLK